MSSFAYYPFTPRVSGSMHAYAVSNIIFSDVFLVNAQQYQRDDLTKGQQVPCPIGPLNGWWKTANITPKNDQRGQGQHRRLFSVRTDSLNLFPLSELSPRKKKQKRVPSLCVFRPKHQEGSSQGLSTEWAPAHSLFFLPSCSKSDAKGMRCCLQTELLRHDS